MEISCCSNGKNFPTLEIIGESPEHSNIKTKLLKADCSLYFGQAYQLKSQQESWNVTKFHNSWQNRSKKNEEVTRNQILNRRKGSIKTNPKRFLY